MMADLPALTSHVERALALRWENTLEATGLTGQHLHWHEAERTRRRRIEAQSVSSHPGGDRDAEEAVDNVGIDKSTTAARGRFGDLVGQYWGSWYSSGNGYEVFIQWLDILKRKVLSELNSVWQDGSDAVRRWYSRACEPAVDEALSGLLLKHKNDARNAELQRIEATLAIKAGSGRNPILDEIYLHANSRESISQLIETGAPNLSPEAQAALRMAREKIAGERVSIEELGVTNGGSIEDNIETAPQEPTLNANVAETSQTEPHIDGTAQETDPTPNAQVFSPGFAPSRRGFVPPPPTEILMGTVPSRQSFGIPSLDLQQSFPPERHSPAGGPADLGQRADLYDEIGWLARAIQVLEGPPGLLPGEALDRLLHRITGQTSGEANVEFALNEFKKHCRASGVYRLEIGDPAKAEAFEELAAKFEGLHAKYFRQAASTMTFENYQNASDRRFSQQHKAEFKELLAEGLELHALNSSDESLDFGPWRVYCTQGDSHSEGRIKARFRAAARKAAAAAGAPSRVNLLDWWISKLARGKRHRYLQGLIQLSTDFCAELESNAMELRPIIDELDSTPGLRRDRYPCDHPVPYWLYAEPHRALPEAQEEFAFWDERIWGGFGRSIEVVAGWRRERRCWIDANGSMQVEPNEEARLRVKKRVERRTELLKAWTLGLSYDVAVLQANYIIDRGLRMQGAMRAFELESTELAERIRQSWRAASKRWGLSWKKQEKKGVDFEKPFREVGADLRHLLFSPELPGGQATEIDVVPAVVELPQLPGEGDAKKAAARQAIVMPILGLKGWSRGRWATEAGVGKNSVYEYLDGKRQLSPENRRAMAEVLGLDPAVLLQ
jgi:hypothetical protein